MQFFSITNEGNILRVEILLTYEEVTTEKDKVRLYEQNLISL